MGAGIAQLTQDPRSLRDGFSLPAAPGAGFARAGRWKLSPCWGLNQLTSAVSKLCVGRNDPANSAETGSQGLPVLGIEWSLEVTIFRGQFLPCAGGLWSGGWRRAASG